jgi:deoxyhypusine synthase
VSPSNLQRRPRIDPLPNSSQTSIVELVDRCFLSYNAGRLREACQLFARKLLEPDVTIGVSLTGALTPAGLATSALVPLIEAGFVDWMVSTGANLYHDTHFGIGLTMHQGHPGASDVELRKEGVVRIYDIFFDYDVLLTTDAFYREVIRQPEFQSEMGTAEFHYKVGAYVRERERALGQKKLSLLAAAHEHALPIYTSSPGDSSIGMNVAATELEGNRLRFNPSRDVNETAAIVWNAKQGGGKSAVVILGGGSPKNFILQTEPQIQEVLGLAETGHDYFVQMTDARPDTGGLSGATPSEAVSWGKINPESLPDTIVCYLDSTVGLPILAAYALASRPPRKPRRLYEKREALHDALRAAYLDRVAQGG